MVQNDVSDAIFLSAEDHQNDADAIYTFRASGISLLPLPVIPYPHRLSPLHQPDIRRDTD